MESYLNKPSDYFEHARMDVLRCLGSVEGKSILELGAGGGYTLAHAKTVGKAAYVAGVELMNLEGNVQQNQVLDEFHICDLSKGVPSLKCKSFDVLLCPDVLEHLAEPWDVLRNWSVYLKPGGRLLISIPNIREISVLWKIGVRGDFGYTPDGILDQTHLRFFARRNAKGLPDPSQYEQIQVVPAMHYQQGPRFRPLFSRLSLGWADDFLTHQWFVTAQKRS